MNDSSPAPVEAKKPKTIYTPVTMADGSVVEFPGDTKITTSILGDYDGVRFNFRNGRVLDASTDLGGLTKNFAVHGITQKLRDEAAGEKDVDDAFEAINSLYGRLSKGEWSVKREGGGFAGQSMLVQALVRVYGKTQEEIRTFLDTGNNGKPFTQAEKMKMRQDSRVKAVIDELEAAKAAAASGPAASELLSGLGG